MNKIIVVTGGANGIGRCLVETFAADGDEVFFIDMDAEATESLQQRMTEHGYRVTGYVGDVAETAELNEFADMVLAHRPEGIDCLINNACLMHGGVLAGCTYEDFLYVQKVGVAAPFWLSKLFADHFRGVGSIVNISSSRAFQSQPNTESYTAAKGGITALTHALAVSLRGKARVNSIAPGWIDVEGYHRGEYEPHYSKSDELQHPSQRVGEPADIARAVAFLCDSRNSFVNGENITIDGGMTKQMIYHDDCGWTYSEEK